jgi:transposase InsO family protein
MELGRRRVAGKRIGDHQVGIYEKLRTSHRQEVAAAKAGISVRSARRIDSNEALPSQRDARSWRTRADPFEAVWQSEIVPILEASPALTATTLLEEVQRRHPGNYDDALLRTLQRRVRTWSASHGAEREVFFAQAHPPGRLGLSDFTHTAVLQVTVAGVALLHLFVSVCVGLLRLALCRSSAGRRELHGAALGAAERGVDDWRRAWEHRTDSLAAAFKNKTEHELLTRRYEALCTHYGMRPSRNNLGVSHENGSIESRQNSLKLMLEQALLLRGHRDFAAAARLRLILTELRLPTVKRLGGSGRAVQQGRMARRALPCRRDGT